MHEPELIDKIAVIGMAGRFPGASDTSQLWRNLRDGIESLTFFSDQELLAEGVDPALVGDPDYVRGKGIVEGIELFDAGFFGMTPKEAQLTDPQHRLALECAWQALEDAGCDPSRYAGRIGVFAGSGQNYYLTRHLLSNPDFVEAAGGLEIALHNQNDHLTSAISYKLNLRGPSLTVQTACSTSLVALHLACQSLLNYQCEAALAGGVSLLLPLKAGALYVKGGVLSPDGHCRPFDHRAQGTVAGNGAAMLVLKRLEDALREGDSIRAVILGSAVNNDGAAKVGYTAPSADGQAEVIAEALSMAGVEADSLSYIETHGTATPLGDPIEFEALRRVFGQSTRGGYCALGAVKANLGHLDTAAGAAGLIKTVLALQQSTIPPLLHFEAPNPKIELDSSPFYAPRQAQAWESPEGRPRRAGVSSFGMGGTNAHVVLEQAPPQTPGGPSRPWQLVCLSARSPSALDSWTTELGRHLEQNPQISLPDAAFTLQKGRRAFDQRRIAVCPSLSEAAAGLSALDHSRLLTAPQPARERSAVFLFPGQGTQFPGMAADLYNSEPVFRAELDRCAELLSGHLGPTEFRVQSPESKVQSPKSKIGSRRSKAQGPESMGASDSGETLDLGPWTLDSPSPDVGPWTLDQRSAQPALFAFEYALARLWISWGVLPRAMLGHSLGEYVAACLSGVFSLPEALALVTARGRLMQGLPQGDMLSVSLTPDELGPHLTPDLSLAAVNRPDSCVVSGPSESVEGLERRLAGLGLECRRLQTSHAFHSAMMDPILKAFSAELEMVRRGKPSIPFVSNLTGEWISPAQAVDPAYWVRHLRETVRFSDGLGRILQDADCLLLEVGPGHVLSGIARNHPARRAEQPVVASLGGPGDALPQQAQLLQALGRVWMQGVDVDWDGFYAGEQRRKVPLPTYPFERQRYWVEPGRASSAGRPRDAARSRGEVYRFYLPCWGQSPPKSPSEAQLAALKKASWLLFEDDWGISEGLAARLSLHYDRGLVRVRPGEEFARIGEGAFALNPARSQDYESLLQALRDEGRLPDRIVHLWSVTAEDLPASEALTQELLDRGFYSLLAMVQAWGRLKEPPQARIDTLVSNAWPIGGEKRLFPEKATLLGLCRVIPQEYPRLSCSLIDLASSEPALIDLLGRELACEPDGLLTALRHGRRWKQHFEPLQLNDGLNPSGRLRQQGVYLVTGGLGGIGLEVADHLARTRQARLVLLGRSPESIRRQAERIRAMREAGAEVLALNADVSERRQLDRALQEVRRVFGPIQGLIHAAGVAGSGLIHLKSRSQAQEVLAAKIVGTRLLEELLADDPLDFRVFFSTLTAQLGGYGQSDYAAANAFLDAYAQQASGAHTVSIGWDAWAGAGMRARRLEDGTGLEPVGHPLLERRLPDEGAAGRTYSAQLSPATHWVLDEHRILGRPVLPGVAYLEMARAALHHEAPNALLELRDVYFLSPLTFEDGQAKTVRTMLEENGQGFDFRILASDAASDEWQEHAVGQASCRSPESAVRHDLRAISEGLGEARLVVDDRLRLEDGFGPRWHCLKKVLVGRDELLGEYELPEKWADDLEDFQLHSGLLDRLAGSSMDHLDGRPSYMPWACRRMTIRGRLPRRVFCHARPCPQSAPETSEHDILVLDEDGLELVRLEGFSFRKTGDLALKFQEKPARRVAELSVQQGLEALERIVERGEFANLAVAVEDLQEALQRVENREATGIAPQTPQARSTRHARPGLSVPYQPPRDATEERLAEIWQEVLGIDQVGIHDNFLELGGDSVQVIQVVARGNRQGLRLDPQQIFERPTIAELAEAVSRQRPDQPSAPEPERPRKEGDWAPEDFPLMELDQEGLAELVSRIEDTDSGGG